MTKIFVYVLGGKRHFEALEKEADDSFEVVHIADERGDKAHYARSSEELVAAFEQHYSPEQTVGALINFGRATVIGGIENIAKACETIKAAHPALTSVKYVGPSYEAAKIFFDKARTYYLFEKEGVARPSSIVLGHEESAATATARLGDDGGDSPIVIKATNLSGGRGMKLVETIEQFPQAYEKFRSEYPGELIISEYVEGLEVSFAVLRLGDTFLRMPACYKEATSLDLNHPDSKVKLAGGLKEFDAAYEAIENIMRQQNISGFLYLEGILQQQLDGSQVIKFIEGATRLSGNSVIEFGALKDFNFYKTLLQWIKDSTIAFAYESQLCIQYSTFVHNGQEDVGKLLAKEWTLEALYEDLSALPFSTDTRTRIRISFVGGTSEQAKRRAAEIAEIVGNPSYSKHVESVLDSYQKSELLYAPTKLSSGQWDDNISWEFFLSRYLPKEQLCTATFCLALHGDQDVVLTRTKRGWEMLGGHLEPEESLKIALFREAHEEGGYTPERYQLFGYRKITAKQPVPARAGREYPFPSSYIPHFIAKSDLPVEDAHGEEDEVLEHGIFPVSQLADLNINEIAIVEAGLAGKERL